MARRRRIASGVATVLVLTVGLVAVASLTGIPPGGRVRVELFQPREDGGTPAGPASDSSIIGRLEQEDRAHWGGSFIRGNTLVVTYADVDQATARAALTDAGVSDSVRLERRSTSLAEADDVRGRIQATGLMGARIVELGFDASRAVVVVDARRPDLALVRRIDRATAGSDLPVRIHWLFAAPRAS